MDRSGTDGGQYIRLGLISRAHGIRGEVKVQPYSGQPGNFLGYRRLLVDAADREELMVFEVLRSRVQGRQVVLHLVGCDSREAAEAMAGREVWLKRSDLPAPAEDEIYLADLVGKEAVSEKGSSLGRITGIVDTAAHPVLSVTDRGREYLIPVHAGVVVSLEEERVVLRLPAGLLEINDR